MKLYLRAKKKYLDKLKRYSKKKLHPTKGSGVGLL